MRLGTEACERRAHDGALRAGLRSAVALLLTLGFASPVLAQSAAPAATPAAPEDQAEEEHFYTAETWRVLVEGKTLTYRARFGIMGREYYVPGSNRVVFVYFDGRCYDGTWSEEDGVFCFAYDGLHCFRHLSRGDKVIAREMDGEEQVVISITDEKLSCKPDLLSRAPLQLEKDDQAS